MCYSPQVVVAVALVLVLCFEYANSFAQIHTISSRTRTSRSSNSVRSIPTANGLASGRHPFARHPLHYLQPRRRGLQLHASAYDSLWSAAAVPGGYDAVEDLLAKSLDRALDQLGPATDTGSSNSRRRLSVDLLTPGLNPKLEQKAILLQPYLFDLVIATFPVLNLKFSNVRLAFESTGDAAGFQSYCYSNGVEIPESFSLSEINREYMSNRIDCVLVVSAKNNVGNPVIRELQFLCESMASATFVFLNCDLSDKVATGMTDKTVRDNFRTSIRPAFYFRNIVLMSRPTLVPTEVGVLLYTPNSGWKVFAVNDEDVSGPGSLNRFMKQATFQRSPRDPTPTNPPRFAKIASYEEMPKKEEIGQIMSRAAFLNAKYEREKARAESVGLSSSSSGERIAIDSVATALQVLNYTINGNRYTISSELGLVCSYYYFVTFLGMANLSTLCKLYSFCKRTSENQVLTAPSIVLLHQLPAMQVLLKPQ